MIQLFPRASGCEWCGGEHPQAQLCHARPGLTRRSFLCLATTAAVAAIVAPAMFIESPSLVVPVEYGPNASYLGASWAQMDAILKETYLPVIVAELNRPNAVLRFMDDEHVRAQNARETRRTARRQRFAEIARVA